MIRTRRRVVAILANSSLRHLHPFGIRSHPRAAKTVHAALVTVHHITFNGMAVLTRVKVGGEPHDSGSVTVATTLTPISAPAPDRGTPHKQWDTHHYEWIQAKRLASLPALLRSGYVDSDTDAGHYDAPSLPEPMLIRACQTLSALLKSWATRGERRALMYKTVDHRGMININPEIRFGKPCIRNTRICVFDVFELLAGGMTHEELLEELPSLTPDDLLACYSYITDEHMVPRRPPAR
jgi:uncharacterized protein (DUF433 family)